jgi:hypothetical protein
MFRFCVWRCKKCQTKENISASVVFADADTNNPKWLETTVHQMDGFALIALWNTVTPIGRNFDGTAQIQP